jgi:hypothetical protein
MRTSAQIHPSAVQMPPELDEMAEANKPNFTDSFDPHQFLGMRARVFPSQTLKRREH